MGTLSVSIELILVMGWRENLRSHVQILNSHVKKMRYDCVSLQH